MGRRSDPLPWHEDLGRCCLLIGLILLVIAVSPYYLLASPVIDYLKWRRKMNTVVYDFWAPTCPPCRMFGPTFDAWAKKYGESAKFVKVDVSEEYDLAAKFSISAIPCVVVERDGVVVKKWVGAPREDDLAAIL